ncbi:GNAT family N-acetyltransferase [Streptomyces sp. NPDC086782]|uniref:GNAT family N-acetyltransferase n=2 Tax=unclassified Streptomyces TaxID=2593676 RepID=UPI00380F7A4E
MAAGVRHARRARGAGASRGRHGPAIPPGRRAPRTPAHRGRLRRVAAAAQLLPGVGPAHRRAPTFAPAMSALAFDGGQLVGAAIALDPPETGEGYIEQVAVHRDHRNQGIARLLLLHAFRAFHRQGRRTCTLGTHSETGALTLYLRVGMRVRHSSTVCRKSLGVV